MFDNNLSLTITKCPLATADGNTHEP